MVLKILIIFFFINFSFPYLYAQEELNEEEEIEEIPYSAEEYVIYGTRIKKSENEPSSFSNIIVIDKENSNFQETKEILSKEVGIKIEDTGGESQQSFISIRGSTPKQVTVLIDGVRVNNSQWGTFDLSTIPSSYIEKIEVIRGGGFLYGKDGIGGVINIVTKFPQKSEREIGVSYGSFDTLKLDGSLSGKLKTTFYAISGCYNQSDGDFTYYPLQFKVENGLEEENLEKITRINNRSVSGSGNFKLNWKKNDTNEIKLNENIFYISRGAPGINDTNQQEFAHEKVMRNIFSIKYIKNEILEKLDFNVSISNIFEQTKFKDPKPSLGNPIDTVNNNLSNIFELGFNYSFKLASIYHFPEFLFQIENDRLWDETLEEGFGNKERFTLNLFTQDEIQFFERKFLIIPGVKFEYEESLNTKVLPKIGVIIQPKPIISFKGNLRKNFRQPTFSELYFPDEGFLRGNENLKPEESIDFDSGFDFNLKYLLIEGAYFYRAIKNSIDYIYSAYTVYPENTGNVKMQGIEFSENFTPLKWISISGNYTYLNSIRGETGKGVAGKPNHTINGRLDFNFNYLKLYSEIQYVSKIPIDNTGISFLGENASFDSGITLNLVKIFHLNEERFKSMYLNIEGKNLGDASIRDSKYFPLPGRRFFVTYTSQF